MVSVVAFVGIECTKDGSNQVVVVDHNVVAVDRSTLNTIVDDLVLLDEVNVPRILHVLHERFKKNLIYTSVGPILIAVNPYERFPLYTRQTVLAYATAPDVLALAPHIFQISAIALNAMRKEHKDQCILISGESGAGKTEATKQVLHFVSQVRACRITPPSASTMDLMANDTMHLGSHPTWWTCIWWTCTYSVSTCHSTAIANATLLLIPGGSGPGI